MPTPVTFVPNPANPHPNETALPLGGDLLVWPGLDTTDYGVEMFGGPGTVELTAASSLVNSSFTLDGPNANLVNDGIMRLQQSQLMINGSLAGYGTVIATQGSTIIAASTVPSQIAYLPGGPAPDQTVTAKATYPTETVVLQSSALDIGSGVPSSYPGNPVNFWSAPVVMDGSSIINLEGTFVVGAQDWGVYSTGPNLGTLNAGGPTTVSGIMQVDANMVQGGRYTTLQVNGGRLMLAGSAVGGNIDITSGTLEFAQAPGFMHGPETSSEAFRDTIQFGGSQGAVQFDGTIGRLIIGITPDMSEIAVFSGVQEIASLHIAPAATPYSAAEFSVRGNELLFHHTG